MGLGNAMGGEGEAEGRYHGIRVRIADAVNKQVTRLDREPWVGPFCVSNRQGLTCGGGFVSAGVSYVNGVLFNRAGVEK